MITKQFLKENPNYIFVFGDNKKRIGKKGAAKLRDMPNSYGFITKKAPNNRKESFYTPYEYQSIFEKEKEKLKNEIKENPNKTFLISKIGSGLANKFEIFEEVIKPGLKDLIQYENVKFLFNVNKKN